MGNLYAIKQHFHDSSRIWGVYPTQLAATRAMRAVPPIAPGGIRSEVVEAHPFDDAAVEDDMFFVTQYGPDYAPDRYRDKLVCFAKWEQAAAVADADAIIAKTKAEALGITCRLEFDGEMDRWVLIGDNDQAFWRNSISRSISGARAEIKKLLNA